MKSLFIYSGLFVLLSMNSMQSQSKAFKVDHVSISMGELKSNYIREKGSIFYVLNQRKEDPNYSKYKTEYIELELAFSIYKNIITIQGSTAGMSETFVGDQLHNVDLMYGRKFRVVNDHWWLYINGGIGYFDSTLDKNPKDPSDYTSLRGVEFPINAKFNYRWKKVVAFGVTYEYVFQKEGEINRFGLELQFNFK